MNVTILMNIDSQTIDSVYASADKAIEACRENRSLAPFTFCLSDSPTDLEKIRDEAVRLYPDSGISNTYDYNGLMRQGRAAHISCAKQYAARLHDMGQLLMDKDGQIESLENRVKELEGKLSTAKAIIQQQGGIISKHHL